MRDPLCSESYLLETIEFNREKIYNRKKEINESYRGVFAGNFGNLSFTGFVYYCTVYGKGVVCPCQRNFVGINVQT